MSPVAAKAKAAVPEILATVTVTANGQVLPIEPAATAAPATARKTASRAKTAAPKTAASKTAAKPAAKGTKAAAKPAVVKPVVVVLDDAPDGDDQAEAGGELPKDAKSAKALASIKVGPKGVYTEDSIRVYLQEIGRIRLLRPDEEIELARKIADLLELEEKAAEFEADKGHFPDTKEWAAIFDMPLIKFRRRLMLGRRAKEKMVQSNLRLVV